VSILSNQQPLNPPTKTKIGILVPIFNEAQLIQTIGMELSPITRYGIEILLVDDGSTDDFRKQFSLIRNEKFTKLQLSKNLGYGGAVRAGLQKFYDQSFDWVIIVDSDLSSDVIEIEKVINHILDTNDIKYAALIKPSRFINKKESGMIGVKYWRLVATSIANFMARLLVNYGVSDPTNGFRAINIKRIGVPSTNSNGFDSIVEELKIVMRGRYRIDQIPTILNHEKSLRNKTSFSYNPNALFNYLSHLFQIFVFLNLKKFEFLFGFLIIIFSYFWAINTIQNSELRLAQISSDDGIIAHVLSWAEPENFAGDPRASNFSSEIWASGINWVPALFYEYLKIDPVLFHNLFSFLQNFLYPISLYIFIQFILNRKLISWLLVLTVLNTRPFLINVSWYGDLEWMPYSNWISMIFAIFSIAYLYKKNTKSFLIFFSLTGLTHPVMGFSIFVFSVLLIFINKSITNKIKTVFYISALMTTIYAFIKILTPSNVNPRTNSQILAIYGNTHGNSFYLNPSATIGDPVNLYYFYWFIFLVLFILLRKFIDADLRYLFISLNMTTLLFLVLHWFFYITNFTEGYILILTRITIITSVINFVIILSAVALSFQSKLFISSVVNLFWILVPSPLNSLLLIFSRIIAIKRFFTKIIFFVLFILSLFTYYILNREIIVNLKNLFLSLINTEFYTFAVILFDTISSSMIFRHSRFGITLIAWIACLSLILSVKFFSKNFKIFVFNLSIISFCIVFSFNLLDSRTNLYSFRDLKYSEDLLQVQKWSFSNTSPGTCFISENHDIYGSWRNVARRPVRIPVRQGGFYNTTDYAESYNLLVDSFMSERDYPEQLSRNEVFYRDFAFFFNCKILVWKQSWIELDFNKIFYNDNFILYEID
jgi:hypothetical protein